MLKKLITEGQQYSSEYKGILANHLPMSLCALSALGADDYRLKEFFDFYKGRLSPQTPTVQEINQNNWTEFLGQHHFHTDYLNFFQLQLKKHGREKLLAEYLPKLLQAPGSGAFHGLIRTAYAVEFSFDSEIAEGLAYWSICYLQANQMFSTPEITEPTPSALQIIVMAMNDESFLVPPTGKNIIERQEKIYFHPSLGKYASKLKIIDQSLEELTAATMKAYAITNDFTLLHSVTGTHALRLLLPFVKDRITPLRCHWVDVLAASLTILIPQDMRSTLLCCMESDDLPQNIFQFEKIQDWKTIQEAAILSNDDHVSKLVYSCKQQEDFYGWLLFRQLAIRQAGIKNPPIQNIC